MSDNFIPLTFYWKGRFHCDKNQRHSEPLTAGSHCSLQSCSQTFPFYSTELIGNLEYKLPVSFTLWVCEDFIGFLLRHMCSFSVHFYTDYVSVTACGKVSTIRRFRGHLSGGICVGFSNGMINEGSYQRWLMKSSLSPVFPLLFILALVWFHCFAWLDCTDFVLHNETGNNGRVLFHFPSLAILALLSAFSMNDSWMSLYFFLSPSPSFSASNSHWFLTMNGDWNEWGDLSIYNTADFSLCGFFFLSINQNTNL